MVGRKIAIVATIAGVAVLSVIVCGACWSRQKIILGEAHRLPRPADLVLPDMAAVHAMSDSITEASMRNVSFYVDDQMRLGIRDLRGRLRTRRPDNIKILDNKNELILDIAYGNIALTENDVTIMLNRYVFGYRGSPLKDLLVRTKGDHIVQTGTMHKIIDIPFEMEARLSVTPEGLIRIHPIRMDICGLNGEKLLRAVGRNLSDLLDLRGSKGAHVEGNDILLDPLVSLPPPTIHGRLTDIRVEGKNLVQTFGSTSAATALTPPVDAKNYMYFRGGVIRFGKLFMALTDLQAIDADESDPFDFYLEYYHTQLVAGYHRTMADYALVAWMPDFDDIGSPKGKVPPPPIR